MSGKNLTECIEADALGIARAAAILREGGVAALPTETVYGLAARADDPAAVARIYEAKGRPSFNPLIIHVSDLDMAQRYGTFCKAAQHAARLAWPGPLTLVVPLRDDAGLAPAVTAGLSSVAIRVPAHPIMRAVIAEAQVPLAAPSANASNHISPTSADHVLATLDGRIDLVLDGGPCQTGLESTILAIRGNGVWDELRPGPIDLAAIAQICGYTGTIGHGRNSPAIEAPGQLSRHYSPGKPVRLNAQEAAADEYFIGFDSQDGHINLSKNGNLEEAASRLYLALHLGANSAFPRIACAPIPNEGVGKAINDRLTRAAQ